MDLGIAGRVGVVGGASSGLGRACALRLAREGCSLVIWARGSERLERTAQELRDAGAPRVEVVAADAGRPDAAMLVAERALDVFGGADILVLNAGGPPPVLPADLGPDDLRAALQMLAETPVRLANLLVPGMRERRWGRIVAILSWGVREPVANLPLSNMGRSALAAYLKTLSLQVAADGITVNGVLPGRFATPRIQELDRLGAEREGRPVAEVQAQARTVIPAGRDGDPDELGALVAFLCSVPASYISGTLVPVDGGMLKSLG